MPEREQSKAASKRNLIVVVLARNEEAARELLAELADEPRVVAAYAELGESRYLIAEPSNA